MHIVLLLTMSFCCSSSSDLLLLTDSLEKNAILELNVSGSEPPSFGRAIREELFLLAEGITFANHGSFGAVARPVLEVQRRLQDLQETSPDDWFRHISYPLWMETRKAVAEFVVTCANNVVIVDNATTAVNCVLKSLHFTKTDALLVTDHAYPAVDYTACAVSHATEARVVRHCIPFLIENVDQFGASFEATLDANTDIRIAIVEHISCQSAILLPLKRLIEICHSRNVPVMVDGAHAPGQVVIDLDYLDPDYYTGMWSLQMEPLYFLE